VGMNAPIGRSVQLIHAAAPVRRESTTEEMHRVLNELLDRDKGAELPPS